MKRRYTLRVFAHAVLFALTFLIPTGCFAAAATHFSVSAPATAAKDVPFSFTVTAQDAANATDAAYAGTVHFSIPCCGGYGTTLPNDSTLTSGVGTFQAIASSPGSFNITATDTSNGSITGTSGTISIPNINNTS